MFCFPISDHIMVYPRELFLSNGVLCRGGSRGRVQGMRTPLPPEMTCGFLKQLVFCKKKKTMWFIGVEVEQETSAPPPKKNPGSAPVMHMHPRAYVCILLMKRQTANSLENITRSKLGKQNIQAKKVY